MGYSILHLGDVLDVLEDETECKGILANFSCPFDEDIEYFLKDKAIINQKMGLSRTYLVYARYKNENVLAGYFAITVKPLIVRSKVSGVVRKKITGFRSKEPSEVSVFLIGQLSKNFANGYAQIPLITGRELLGLAMGQILKIRHLIGGRVILVECRDEPHLRRFYEDNGFEFVEQDGRDGLLKYIIEASKVTVE